jgi:hypothetical protein
MRHGFPIAAVVIAALIATSAPAAPAPEAGPALPAGAVFMIGTPDGLGGEFGGAEESWPEYLKVFPKPVVYTVGKSKVTDWPYIHPSNDDKWAGGRPHTFTIRFASEKGDPRPLCLIIGLNDAMPRPPLVTVAVNGAALPPQRAPAGVARGAFDPDLPHTPGTMIFILPAGAVRAGDNEITIHCETASWIVYDYVLLTANATPPKLPAQPPPRKPRAKKAADAEPERDDTLLEKALAGPLAGAEEVVFAARQPGKDGHWYANFSYYAEDAQRLTYGDGGKLCRMDLRSGKVTVLLDDPKGGVRDPQVHYDGKRIVFSYRKSGGLHYNLYEMSADGSGLRQLTDGPYDDIEPTYLADGGIMFVSSRCQRWVNCWLTQVAVLYRCDADGRNVRMVSSNNEQDNTPWPLHDGTILYTRWEYVDRSQVHYHHLWIVNPDGADQMVYYGNQWPGLVMIDSKPIPGTDKIVSIFSPGHGQKEHAGPVAVVDPNAGPDDPAAGRIIARGGDFRDPYPLSEDCLLVARGADLLVMNGRGAVQTVYTLSEADRKAGLWLHEPRPLMPREREPVVAAKSNRSEAAGRLMLVDVTKGRNMAGVRPGDVKKLLVLESLPKPINFTGGMEPLSYGGTFTLERVLGTVPVEADGSAYFEAPALRSLIFVALDERDLAVKRMQSFVTLQPGETSGCVGCHEKRTDTGPRDILPSAFARPPSRLSPVAGVPAVYDFPRDIQPILDRHCVKCHGYEKTAEGGPRAGGIILTGDRGPMFSHSYHQLSVHQQFADGRNRPQSNYAPYAFGSGGSPLMKLCDSGHYGVKLEPRERTMLRLWLDTGAPYPGTYAALGCGMVGGYAQNSLDRSDQKWPSVQAAAEVLKDRCGKCHTGGLALPNSPSDDRGMPPWAIQYGDPKTRFTRHILYNLSRPEISLLVLAPLAKAAGGWGLCHEAAGKPSDAGGVIAGTQDAAYQVLLASVRDAAKHLDEIKRFDMPGFRPRDAYVRELKRYGVLPADQPSGAPLDPYALEEKYWQTFWYRPAKQ